MISQTELVSRAVEHYGGVTKCARAAGCWPSHISESLRGTRNAPMSLVLHCGYARVPVIRDAHGELVPLSRVQGFVLEIIDAYKTKQAAALAMGMAGTEAINHALAGGRPTPRLLEALDMRRSWVIVPAKGRDQLC